MQAEFKGQIYTVNTWSGRRRNFGEIPKTYTRLGVASFVENRGHYNPNVASVFLNRKGQMIIELYCDGNFYPYYCDLVAN